jgi:hypothetical protein
MGAWLLRPGLQELMADNGRRVWNRLRYMKDPSTGKRISRPNPRTG